MTEEKEPQDKKRNAGKTVDAACTIGRPSAFDMQNIARGMQKTVVIGIECGACNQQWKDALVPNQETLVTCPHCGATNRVTLHARVYFV